MYNESIQKEKEKIKEIMTLSQYKLQYDQMQKDFLRVYSYTATADH